MVKLLQKILYPHSLQTTKSEHLEFKHGLNKDVKAYVDLLCKEAVIHERLRAPRSMNEEALEMSAEKTLEVPALKRLKLRTLDFLRKEPRRKLYSS